MLFNLNYFQFTGDNEGDILPDGNVYSSFVVITHLESTLDKEEVTDELKVNNTLGETILDDDP